MLGEPTQFQFVLLLFAAMTFVSVLFLPVSLEFRELEDVERRKSKKKAASGDYQLHLVPMENSDEVEVDLALIEKISNLLSILPNLEA